MLGTVTIALINLYGPGLQQVFKMRPIPGMFWGLPFSFALGILMMDELRKLIVRTYPKVRMLVLCVRDRLADRRSTSRLSLGLHGKYLDYRINLKE